MKHNCLIYIILTIAILLSSCRSQPDYVIDEDRMVDLLIDVHKTEAVITLNYTAYPTDEKKRAMREAVYMRHNTSKAEFDTSLVWYGNHLDVYMEVYDKVLERLKAEDEEIKRLIAEEDAQVLTMDGDTIDVWKQERWYVFNPNKGENILAFNIDNDENFRRLDHFTLRFHTINTPQTGNPSVVYLAARHNNQLIHYNHATVKEGWNSIKIQSDSLHNIDELYGYIAMPPRKNSHIMYVDSIELIRIHNTATMPREEFNTISIENKKSENTTPKANKKETPKAQKNKNLIKPKNLKVDKER